MNNREKNKLFYLFIYFYKHRTQDWIQKSLKANIKNGKINEKKRKNSTSKKHQNSRLSGKSYIKILT